MEWLATIAGFLFKLTGIPALFASLEAKSAGIVLQQRADEQGINKVLQAQAQVDAKQETAKDIDDDLAKGNF